ncbi:MAG: M23 family metallopeptidase [Bacillota bacterium]|nr:M23 family metallopeptidase [Bacillota bacterium]
MPARLARNTAISLLIFAIVLAITRSNLAISTTARSYVEAVLTRSTDLAEIRRAVRDASLRLLGWNPWREGARGENARNGAGGAQGDGGEPPGGGPDGADLESGIVESAALSLAHLPEDGGVRVLDGVENAQSQPRAQAQVQARGQTQVQAEVQGQASPPGQDLQASPAPRERPPVIASRAPAVAAAPAAAVSAGREQLKLTIPVNGRVTYGFGYRVHPIYKRRLFHQGIDIAAPTGTPIRAAAAGKVLRAGPCGTYGNIVELDHGGGASTLYAHCSRVLVKAGDRVRAGQKIAEVGSTGLSTGPHLHFEVSIDGKPRDPFAHLEGVRRDRL